MAAAVSYTDDFVVLGLVGSGSFGRVYLIEHRVTHQQFARKDVDLSKLSKEQLEDVDKEVEMMEKTKHPYILNIISSIKTPEYLYIFTEFCFGGDLKKFIASVAEPQLPEQLIVCWLIQLAESLQYLHGKRILHRDIKPDNIYLSDEGDIKLGDFGISRQLNPGESLATTFAGAPCYMSPEVLSQKGYNSKTDIWSLGCVIYELATSQRAFNVNSFPMLVLQVVQGKTPKISDSYNHELVELNCRMMVKDPEKRPSADEILKDTFIVRFMRQNIKPMESISRLRTPSVKGGKIRQEEDIRPVNKPTGPFMMPVENIALTDSQLSTCSTYSTLNDSSQLSTSSTLDSTRTVTGVDTILAKSGSKKKKNKTEKKIPSFETDDDDSMATLMSTLMTSRNSRSSSQLATQRRKELILENIRIIQNICAVGIGDGSLMEAFRLMDTAESIQELEELLRNLLKERYAIYQPYFLFLRILEALLESME